MPPQVRASVFDPATVANCPCMSGDGALSASVSMGVGAKPPFGFNISYAYSTSGAGTAFNYSKGFLTSSLCHPDGLFPFVLSARAPKFATMFGAGLPR